MMEGRTKKKVDEMSVKGAANGGYIVRHSFDNRNAGPSYVEPEQHVFGTHAEALTHIGKHLKTMGGDNDGDEYGGAAKAAGKVTKTPKAPAASKQTGTGKPKAKAPGAKTRGAGAD